MENLYLIILAGIIAVVYSYFLSNQIVSSSPGNSKMQEIAEAIQIGAKAYLNRQYKTIAIVGVVVLIIISYFFSILVGLGYLIGALLSGVAGYVGMLISVKANVRTAEASRKNLASGLSIAFDLPTQIGYDSDDDMSFGEIGKSGVPISTIEDMENLFKDIDLEKISVSMTINSTAAILLAFYFAVAKKRGYNFKKLRGTLQNDILKEYIARGTYIFPIEHSLRLTSNVFEFWQKNIPKWNRISISGYHIREAGSTAVEELAFTFANAITYLDKAKDDGLDIVKLTEQVSFFFNAHRDFFEEIAKFRAARVIWAQIIKDRYKITNVKSQLCRFHVQTGGSTLTAQQIDNNITRTTLESLSAVLGGAQSIHTNGKDEAVSLPSEKNATTALRIQQIMKYYDQLWMLLLKLEFSSIL